MHSEHPGKPVTDARSTEPADPDDATVLIVDDEPRLVGLYEAMLEDCFTVKTAANGAEGLDALSDAVDVVLLDRRMPGVSGDEVLRKIREAKYDCHVGIVSAVDPEFDILEMECDAYVVKPVRKQALRGLVDGLLARRRYSEAVNEMLSISSRLVSLEQEHSEAELADNEAYQELRARKEALESATREEMEMLIEQDEVAFIYEDVMTDSMQGRDDD